MIPVLSRAQMRAFDAPRYRHATSRAWCSWRTPAAAPRNSWKRVCSSKEAGARRNRGTVRGTTERRFRGRAPASWLRGHAVRVLFCGKRERLAGDALAECGCLDRGVGGAIDVGVAEADLPTLRAELSAADIVGRRSVRYRPRPGGERALRLRYRADGAPCAIAWSPSTCRPAWTEHRSLPGRASTRATPSPSRTKARARHEPGAERAGRVEVVDIGIPAALYPRVGNSAELIETRDVARPIRPRSVATHKGSAGRVCGVAGSPGKTGAALLVARGALRAGAGLVTIATSPKPRTRSTVVSWRK